MKALLVTDVQNDFLPGGALAVPEGDEVVPVINELMPAYDLVVATRDWHPANHGSFAANQKNLARYQQAVFEGRLPIERGVVRSAEDELRGAVIKRIICTLRLDFAWVEQSFGVDPRRHFADALKDLREMVGDGLVEIDDHELRVTPRGRFFLRNVCMPFDAYLKKPSEGPQYSRTV